MTDIGTEELAHMEIVAALVYNLIKDAPLEQIKAHGMDGYYADHDRALYFVDATGNPWTATYIQSKGDPIADLHENMAAEEKARATYEWLINLSDDPRRKPSGSCTCRKLSISNVLGNIAPGGGLIGKDILGENSAIIL